jgi:hypothetical protein
MRWRPTVVLPKPAGALLAFFDVCHAASGAGDLPPLQGQARRAPDDCTIRTVFGLVEVGRK